MKSTLFLAVTAAAAALTGCGGASNTTVNVNTKGANGIPNANVTTNANANTSVANSIANAAAKLTTTAPEEFMTMVAQGGMAEVEASKIAAQKSQNPEVKKFAQMMIADHTKADADLKALAAKKNIKLPADMGSFKDMIDDLKSVAAGDFDGDYIDGMGEMHEDDVAAFREQAEKSADPDVKAFAAKTLPTLEKHLEILKGIKSKMK